jgi:sarcosine oxidase subunit beta
MQGGSGRDFVVAGGGVYGCAVAWELVKRGADVLVLEAETIASGASGGLGKRGVRACGRDVRELPLMRAAYELWPGLADEIGAPTGYERTGHLVLIERRGGESQEDLASAAARQQVQERLGIPTQLLDRDAVRSLEPGVHDEVVAALYCPLDGVADHTATTRGLAQAAQGLGAEIREHARVTGLEREGERVTGVVTAHGERIGVKRALLLLSNTHVPAFVRAHLGIELPLWQILPQVLATARVDPMPIRHLIGHASRTLAMKAIPGGRVMISGGWRGRWNPETGRGETVPSQARGNLAEAVAVFPSLAGVAVEDSDAGRPESISIDDIPIIDRLPGVRNMLVGTGWSGHGFAISLAVARLLAGWAVTGERPDLLRPFAYARFLPPDDGYRVATKTV